MACTSPLKAFNLGTKSNGKADLYITSQLVHHLEVKNKKIISTCSDFYSPSAERFYSDCFDIPCGKCTGCRLDRASSWAGRCALEMTLHPQSYFVTFTYDDFNLPVVGDTREDLIGSTLRKKDIQDCFKRIRENISRFRYFGCGEYGSDTFRPHYHYILFGLDLAKYPSFACGRSSRGHLLYYSPRLSDCWGLGMVNFSSANANTANYIARYIVKKDGFVGIDGILAPYLNMSTHPGIGYGYYDSVDMYKHQFVSIPTQEGGLNVYASKYSDRLLEKVDSERLSLIKKDRLYSATNRFKEKLKKTSLKKLDYLKVVGYNKDAQTKHFLERSVPCVQTV